MEENFSIYNFELTAGEMARIRSSDLAKSAFFDHNASETVKMCMG